MSFVMPMFIIGLVCSVLFGISLLVNTIIRSDKDVYSDAYILAYARTKWIITGFSLSVLVFAGSFSFEKPDPNAKTQMQIEYQNCLDRWKFSQQTHDFCMDTAKALTQ